MAWDDAPPSATEVKPSTPQRQWDEAPPTKDEMEGLSVGGFLHNAVEDVKGNVVGLGHLAKGLVTEPIKTLSGVPKGLVEEGKRIGIGELVTGHPINAVKKLGSAAYDKPLSTGLDLSAIYGLGEGVANAARTGAEAGTAAEAGTQALESAKGAAPEIAPKLGTAERIASEAPPPLSMPGEASDILKEPVNPPPAAAEAPQGALSGLADKIPGEIKAPMKEVEDFLSEKYGKIAQRPGIANTAADYLKEHSQNMTLKELGAAPGQVRKIGIDRARELADYAQKNDLVGPKVGSIGREKAIADRMEQAGGAVGGIRKMAADRGAVHDVDGLINQIRSKLDQKYLTKTNMGDLGEVGGLNSGDSNLYVKALAELKRSGGRSDQVAQKLSDMFSEARNLDRLKQPSGPIADVARIARQANDNLIKAKLAPEEAAAYEHALEDYGALTQLREFAKRRSSTEAGGRLGPGSGISRMAVQKFLDSVGYRIESKVANKLADVLRSDPTIMQKPTNMFRHLADEYSSAIDEMGEAPGQ